MDGWFDARCRVLLIFTKFIVRSTEHRFWSGRWDGDGMSLDALGDSDVAEGAGCNMKGGAGGGFFTTCLR